jgi:hypothetical protein
MHSRWHGRGPAQLLLVQQLLALPLGFQLRLCARVPASWFDTAWAAHHSVCTAAPLRALLQAPGCCLLVAGISRGSAEPKHVKAFLESDSTDFRPSPRPARAQA